MLSRCIIIVALLFLVGGESTADKTNWEKFICRPNGVYTPTDATMAAVKGCGAEQCAWHCQAGILGLANEDGTASLELYNEWVDAAFPDEHKALAKKHFADCYEKFGRHINTADKQCVMSKAYKDCNWGLTSQLTCKNAA